MGKDDVMGRVLDKGLAGVVNLLRMVLEFGIRWYLV